MGPLIYNFVTLRRAQQWARGVLRETLHCHALLGLMEPRLIDNASRSFLFFPTYPSSDPSSSQILLYSSLFPYIQLYILITFSLSVSIQRIGGKGLKINCRRRKRVITYGFSRGAPALGRVAAAVTSAGCGIRDGMMKVLRGDVERRDRIVLGRLDVHLVVGVVLFVGRGRVFRGVFLGDGFDDRRATNHGAKGGLMQRRVHRWYERFRGAGTAYRRW